MDRPRRSSAFYSRAHSPRDSFERQSSPTISVQSSESDSVEVEVWGPPIKPSLETILASRTNSNGEVELLVKYKGCSYRAAKWISCSIVERGRKQLLRSFQQRSKNGKLLQNEGDAEYKDGIHSDWLEVDRIIYETYSETAGQCFRVKWQGLGYSKATWEAAKDLDNDKAHLDRFYKYNSVLEDVEVDRMSVAVDSVPDFLNGRVLRDYQEQSLQWMVNNWQAHRNCILGDEMGLGKTAQTIAFLEFQRQFCGVRGPHLAVVPLSTLGHWQKEIETWTDMYTVAFQGTREDREAIKKFEFKLSDARQYKFNVLLTTYEVLLQERGSLGQIVWETIVADEAHKLKDVGSKTRAALEALNANFLLLLTGTPIQNNLVELFSLMNLLNPQEYPTKDAFMDRFGGDPPTVQQIKNLQMELKPILLRRMKEDVEQLPCKDETLVRCPLTPKQKTYYTAIYSKQMDVLLKGNGKKNLSGLRNLSMELRKVCNHPFLCEGLEDDITLRHQDTNTPTTTQLDMLVESSGKMCILDKLLPRLKSEGRKLLIFSQFKIMLNVIEDYLNMRSYPCERIDGDVPQKDRQKAIDRFTRHNANCFVFLLSTRAGGAGITLTAADTVVIYDSDWNPQNDLQAMARCHRIGQDRDVTVYRLIAWDTYEQHLFQCASKKFGLEEALLGNHDAGVDPQKNSKKIYELLKQGAHALTSDEGTAFIAEDIDQILQNRSEKRQIGSRAGSTFSEVTFAVKAKDDKEYWERLLPGPVKAQTQKANFLQGTSPRRTRKKRRINYEETGEKLTPNENDILFKEDEGATSASECESLDNEELDAKRADKLKRKELESREEKWRIKDALELLETFVAFGIGRPKDIKEHVKSSVVHKLKDIEIERICRCFKLMIDRASDIQQRKPRRRHTSSVLAEKMAAHDPAAYHGSAILEGIHIPPFLQKVTQSASFQRTVIQKGKQYKRNLDSVFDLTEFIRDLETDKYLTAPPFCSDHHIPEFCVNEDVELLKGAHKHGYYGVCHKDCLEAILGDGEFRLGKFVEGKSKEQRDEICECMLKRLRFMVGELEDPGRQQKAKINKGVKYRTREKRITAPSSVPPTQESKTEQPKQEEVAEVPLLFKLLSESQEKNDNVQTRKKYNATHSSNPFRLQ